jgi:hypothetical protein
MLPDSISELDFPTVAIVASMGLLRYGFFGAPEETRQQQGRAVYRAPGASVASDETPTPAPPKVPGESR